MDRSRRAHARFPCELKVEVYTGPVGGVRLGEGLLIDISVSGGLLRFSGNLTTGGVYRLRVTAKEAVLDLPGRVARDAGRAGKDPKARHYGLAFNLTGGQEKELRRLLDVVRREQPTDPGEDRFMRGYWG